jgi:hypothetical protein
MASNNTSLHFDLESTTIMAHSSGAVVGRLSADQVVSEWNISDDRFIVEDGVLRLKPGVEIDDETKSLDITITGVDGEGYLSAQSFDMTVIDPDNDNDSQNIFGDDGADGGEIDEMEEGDLDEEEDESEERNDEEFDQVAQGLESIDAGDAGQNFGDETENIDLSEDGSAVGTQSTAGEGVETVEANSGSDMNGSDTNELTFSDDDPLFSMNLNDNELGNLNEDAFILDGSKTSESFSVQAVGSEEGEDPLVFDIMSDENDTDLGQSEMEDFGEDENMGDDVEMEFEELDI